jgi:hypothetical protein
MSLSSTDWNRLKKISQDYKKDYFDYDWWHLKYYLKTADKNGLTFHYDEKGNKEIPYKREVFHRSEGRFSLLNEPVAYFASSWDVATIETDRYFRYLDPFNYETDFWPVVEGKKKHQVTNLFGYPIAYKILRDTLLLDLTDPSYPFYDFILKAKLIESVNDFYEIILLSREGKKVYPVTREIAQACYEKGFQGICYESVRKPCDVNVIGECLVMYDKARVFLP